jgi:NADPH-dependent F420 reductase
LPKTRIALKRSKKLSQDNSLPAQGSSGEKIAILGGTGKQGGGLALRWARAGYAVIVGSRRTEKAMQVAQGLNEKLGAELIRGMSNTEAAQQVDVAVLTVPYSAHRETLTALRDALQGKMLVDVTVPLKPPRVTQVYVSGEGPAAVQAQTVLGDGVRVVSALQNVGEHALSDPEQAIDCDVLVCGDDPEAKAKVIELVQALDPGLRAFDAGPLVNAVVAESLTSILIGLGKQFRRLRVGVRITGLEP